MKRLDLCNFLSGAFSGVSGSFFAMAVVWRNVEFVIPGIVMASICCGIILYNTIEAEEEEEEEE